METLTASHPLFQTAFRGSGQERWSGVGNEELPRVGSARGSLSQCKGAGACSPRGSLADGPQTLSPARSQAPLPQVHEHHKGKSSCCLGPG